MQFSTPTVLVYQLQQVKYTALHVSDLVKGNNCDYSIKLNLFISQYWALNNSND